MIWAVVPVKHLSRAKQRLAPVLSSAARQHLMRAMLDDVLLALHHPAIAGIAVITSDSGVRQQAKRAGARVIDDTTNHLNDALYCAADAVAGWGAHSLLVVPADLPLIAPHDVGLLTAGGPVAFAPARDGGTNAWFAPLRTLPFLFGAQSFERHCAAAVACGLPPRTIATDGLTLDIDRPDDLAALAARSGTTSAQQLARQFVACLVSAPQ